MTREEGEKREKKRIIFTCIELDGSLAFYFIFFFVSLSFFFFFFFFFSFFFFFFFSFFKDTKSRTNDWTILGRKSTHESPIDLKLCHSWKMFKRKTKEEITVSSSMRVSSLHHVA